MNLLNRTGWITVIAALIVGCGGGGGGESSGGESGGGGGESTDSGDDQVTPIDDSSDTDNQSVAFQFFRNDSLSAIDPDSPSEIITVDANADPAPKAVVVPILSGVWNSGPDVQTVTGMNIAEVLYVRTTDGSVRIASVESDDKGALRETKKVSSETSANQICTGATQYDFANTSDSPFVYELPGVDQRCQTAGDNKWFQIDLGMSENTTPNEFPGEPVAAIHNFGDGSHEGWLVLDGKALKRVQRNLNVSDSGLPDNVTSTTVLSVLGDGTLILNVDGRLYRFVPDSDGLQDLGHEFTDANSGGEKNTLASISDKDAFYFVDAGKLWRVDAMNGNAFVLDFAEDDAATATGPNGNVATAGVNEGPMALTDNHVVWTHRNTEGDLVIRRSSKSAPNMIEEPVLFSEQDGNGFVNGALTTPTPSLLRFRTDKWVFYDRIVNDQAQAIIQNVETGQFRGERNALWVGSSFVREAGPSVGTAAASHMFLIKGNQEGTLRIHAFNVVKDPEFAAPPVNLGDLPSNISDLSIPVGFDNQRLGIMQTRNAEGLSQIDVFTLDADRENSFRRLTETPDRNESTVTFF
jgi:hypothetical protein